LNRAVLYAGLGCLGLEQDTLANTQCRPDRDVASMSSDARIVVIGAREDLTIVRETVKVLRAEDKT